MDEHQSDQQYLNDLLSKFNENPDSPEISEPARTLLMKIKNNQQGMSDLEQKINKINEEIKDKQKQSQIFIDQAIRLQGENQGYINAIVSLRL